MDKEREQRMMIEAGILADSPIYMLPKEQRDGINNYGVVRGAFICGVRWADRNPESPWVQINERMPEDSLPNLANKQLERQSVKVMIVRRNGQVMEASRRIILDGKWYWNIPIRMREDITHWMPIPPVPPIIDDLN